MPEFFALLGIDLFLMLSLLSCLLDERVPKGLPYIYQIGALAGFGHLLISNHFFLIFGEYMRFWYCFLFLLVALANVVGINIYFVFVKKRITVAKLLSAAVTFPTIVMSMFFISNYSVTQGATFPLLTLQISMVASIFIMGISIFLLLKREIRQSIEDLFN
jgi:hypothetical protein